MHAVYFAYKKNGQSCCRLCTDRDIAAMLSYLYSLAVCGNKIENVTITVIV